MCIYVSIYRISIQHQHPQVKDTSHTKKGATGENRHIPPWISGRSSKYLGIRILCQQAARFKTSIQLDRQWIIEATNSLKCPVQENILSFIFTSRINNTPNPRNVFLEVRKAHFVNSISRLCVLALSRTSCQLLMFPKLPMWFIWNLFYKLIIVSVNKKMGRSKLLNVTVFIGRYLDSSFFFYLG